MRRRSRPNAARESQETQAINWPIHNKWICKCLDASDDRSIDICDASDRPSRARVWRYLEKARESMSGRCKSRRTQASTARTFQWKLNKVRKRKDDDEQVNSCTWIINSDFKSHVYMYMCTANFACDCVTYMYTWMLQTQYTGTCTQRYRHQKIPVGGSLQLSGSICTVYENTSSKFYDRKNVKKICCECFSLESQYIFRHSGTELHPQEKFWA